MNAVEIGDAVTDLVDQPFDADEFPFAFLECFDNVPTTIKMLRHGEGNEFDLITQPHVWTFLITKS